MRRVRARRLRHTSDDLGLRPHRFRGATIFLFAPDFAELPRQLGLPVGEDGIITARHVSPSLSRALDVQDTLRRRT